MAAPRFKMDGEGRMRVADLAALTDAELDQYLADNNNIVRVSDTGDLPESFLERLRERTRRPNDAACSKPVDLDQVTARLLQAAADGDASPKLRSPLPDSPDSHYTTLLSSPPGNLWRMLHGEMANDGGRPLVPADLIDQVLEDPMAHIEMLMPWLEYPQSLPPDAGCVLTAQLEHWRYFRTWQKYNRDLPSDPDPSRVASKYFYARFLRTSPSYTEALRSLLAHYDFNRPFQLHDDPARQDVVTTWIEYVGWTCAFHYTYSRLVEKHQPAYDEAWKVVVGTGMLRPHETCEYLQTMACGFAQDDADTQAHNDVRLAQSAVEAASSTPYGDSPGFQEARALELSAASTMLEDALTRRDLVTKRNRHIADFVNAIRPYRNASRGKRWQGSIMQWALEQLPLVEAEANTNARSAPSRDADGEAPDFQPNPEHQKQDQPASPRPEAGESSPTRTGTAAQPPHPDDAADDGSRSKRLRRDSSGGAIETGTASPAGQPAPTSPQPASSAPRSRRATRSPAARDSPVAAPEGKLHEPSKLRTWMETIIDGSAQLPASLVTEASHGEPAVDVLMSEQDGTGKRKRSLE